jgi:hypothetical protein
MKNLQIPVLVLASIGVFSSASGQTFYVAEKVLDDDQFSNAAPTPGTNPYLFQAVETTYTYTSVTGPGGTDSIPSVAGGGGTFKFQSSAFATQAALDTAFPDSTPSTPSTYYTFNPSGPSNPLAGDQYPTAPQLTLVNGATPVWSNGDLVLNPTIDNTLTWSPYVATNTEGFDYATGGYIQFKLTGTSVADRQQALGPDGQLAFNTYTVTANTLTQGNTYSLDISYFLADAGTGGSTFNAAGYETDDLITVEATIPEPFTNGMLLVGGALLFLSRRRTCLRPSTVRSARN